MILTVTLHFAETLSADEVDEVTDNIRDKIEEELGEAEYVVQDVGLNFEL